MHIIFYSMAVLPPFQTFFWSSDSLSCFLSLSFQHCFSFSSTNTTVTQFLCKSNIELLIIWPNRWYLRSTFLFFHLSKCFCNTSQHSSIHTLMAVRLLTGTHTHIHMLMAQPSGAVWRSELRHVNQRSRGSNHFLIDRRPAVPTGLQSPKSQLLMYWTSCRVDKENVL